MNALSTASGWKPAQWSCTRPGRVASVERAPPPGTSEPSYTVTLIPALARVTAAANPLGPDPTILAVTIDDQPFGRDLASLLYSLGKRINTLGRAGHNHILAFR